MSVKTVKSISIIGMMSDLDEVIQFCGDSCSFQPDDAMSFYSDTKNFVPLNDKNPYAQPITQLKNACELGGFPLSYAQEPSSQSSDALLAYVNQFVDRTEEIVSRKLLLELVVQVAREPQALLLRTGLGPSRANEQGHPSA